MIGEGARFTSLILACMVTPCMREVSSLLSDRCNFDTFWGSRTEPFLISLADLSTRCGESILAEEPSRWEVLASRPRNERLNMSAVVCVFGSISERDSGYWCWFLDKGLEASGIITQKTQQKE